MGQTKSKNVQTVITNKELGISQNEYNTINQTCTANQSARNILELSDIENSNLTFSQKNEINNLCKLQTLLKSQKDASVLNKTMTALESSQSTEGGLFSAESHNEQTIQTNIKQSLSQDAYNNVRKSCILDQNTDNIISGKRIKGSTVNATQTNALFNECLLNYATENNLTAGLEDHSESGAKSKQKTVGGGLFGGGFMMMLIAIGVMVMVYMSSGGDSGEEQTSAGEYVMYFILLLVLWVGIALIIYGLYYFFKEEEFVLDASTRIDKDKVLRQAGIRPGYEEFSIKESEQAKYFGNNSISNLKRNSLKNLVKENYGTTVHERLNTFPGGPGSNPIPVTKNSFGFGSTSALKRGAKNTLDREGFRFALQDSIFGDGTILKLRADAERQMNSPSPSKTN